MGAIDNTIRRRVADGNATADMTAWLKAGKIGGHKLTRTDLVRYAGASGDFGDAQIELLVLDTNETRVLQRGALFRCLVQDGVGVVDVDIETARPELREPGEAPVLAGDWHVSHRHRVDRGSQGRGLLLADCRPSDFSKYRV